MLKIKLLICCILILSTQNIVQAHSKLTNSKGSSHTHHSDTDHHQHEDSTAASYISLIKGSVYVGAFLFCAHDEVRLGLNRSTDNNYGLTVGLSNKWFEKATLSPAHDLFFSSKKYNNEKYITFDFPVYMQYKLSEKLDLKGGLLMSLNGHPESSVFDTGLVLGTSFLLNKNIKFNIDWQRSFNKLRVNNKRTRLESIQFSLSYHYKTSKNNTKNKVSQKEID